MLLGSALHGKDMGRGIRRMEAIVGAEVFFLTFVLSCISMIVLGGRERGTRVEERGTRVEDRTCMKRMDLYRDWRKDERTFLLYIYSCLYC